MASPLAAVESGLDTLLSSISYTKQKGGTANVPYIGSSPIVAYKRYPLVRLDDITSEPYDCKDRKGWEVNVILEIFSSTDVGHGSNYDINQVEAIIEPLIRDQPYALSLGVGFSIAGIIDYATDKDDGTRLADPSNQKSKPQRVISRDVSFSILINNS